MCFHVDDIMISGPKNVPEFKRMMDKAKVFKNGANGNVTNSISGCRIRQATDKSVTVDQESYARKIDLITMSAHRRKHMTETLSDEEHTTMMAKRGELNWLARQSMIQLLALLSLIDTSKTATGQSLKDLNRLVRQAHFEASDKLHYPVLFLLPMLRGQTGNISVLSVDISALERRDHCWMEVPLLVGQSPGTLADVAELLVHPVLLTQAATQAQEETEFIRLLCLEFVRGGYDDTVIDQEIAKVGGCLIIDAKVFLMQSIVASQQHSPCKTRDRRWKVWL